MVQAVLQTKLFIPPLRSGTVLRRRLTQRLEEGFRRGRRLSLISAPAGYGKTSIVAEWIRQAEVPAAWFSLDQGDNDPARFWAHLLSALRSIPLLRQAAVGAEALSALQSPQLPEIKFLLVGLINEICDLEIAGLSPGVLLVLDDLHLITDSSIHAGLFFLLDHLPAVPQTLHLVISTRSDPPWPLARLRARAGLTELRAQDLRFNPEEVQEYLTRIFGLQLSAANVAALERRTEGWVSGLQMAALSLQRIHQTRGEAGVASFIRSFAGSQRFVLDYLVEEVLHQQLPQIQEFLLKTSLLDRMCAPLCEAVLESRASRFESSQMPLILNESFLSKLDSPRSTLDYLERSNLFLFPLDNEGHWYRYHPLFSDLLRLRLEQEFKDEIPDLHRKASAWYARAGLIAEAVQHSLAAEDHQQIARLVAGNTLALFYSGELPTISRWLGSVSVENPWLQVARAWMAAYAGELQASEAIVQSAESLLGALKKEASRATFDEEQEHIFGHIAAIRAYRSFLSEDFATALAQLDRALEFLPISDRLTRTFAVQVQAAAFYEYGEPDRAVELLEEQARSLPESVDLRVRVMALIELPAHQFQIGRLRRAYETSQRLLVLIGELAGESGELPPIAAFACYRSSRVLYESNDLDGAQQDALKSLEISQRWGQKDCQALASEILARIFQALGKPEEALRTVQEAKRLADQYLPLYQHSMKAREADLHLTQGNLAAAAKWAEASGLTCEDKPLFNRREEYLVFCQVRLAQGRPAEVKKLLGRLTSLAEAVGARPLLLQALALQALEAYTLGDHERSLHFLERALTLAEAEGYIRTFLDLGAPLLQLLQTASPQIQRDTPQYAYARHLLDAFSSSTIHLRKELPPSVQPIQSSTGQPFNLIELLSERELEILHLLNTTLTSAEIAAKLVVAVSTVRTHIRNIYGKLGVNRRLEALERARELGLL